MRGSDCRNCAASGVSTSTIAEYLLLSLPFTTAMTIPMAVLVAVLWVFTRLGADGALAVARREPHGVRRLLAHVLGAAAVVGALMFVLNDQIVPRANERLSTLQVGGAHELGDREMTIGQLRAAARRLEADTAPNEIARAASYEVEIQKKYAISAASVVLALTAAAIAFLLPRGGVVLVIGATLMVFAVYYVGLIAGESLADRLMVSPFVAMWMERGTPHVPRRGLGMAAPAARTCRGRAGVAAPDGLQPGRRRDGGRTGLSHVARPDHVGVQSAPAPLTSLTHCRTCMICADH